MAKWKRKQFVKSLEEFDGYGAYDPWRHGGRHRPLSNAEMRAMAQEQDDQRRKRRKDKNGALLQCCILHCLRTTVDTFQYHLSAYHRSRCKASFEDIIFSIFCLCRQGGQSPAASTGLLVSAAQAARCAGARCHAAARAGRPQAPAAQAFAMGAYGCRFIPVGGQQLTAATAANIRQR